jgi:hypothetical protein
VPVSEDDDSAGPRVLSDPVEALRHALARPAQRIRPVEGIEPEMWEALRQALTRQ